MTTLPQPVLIAIDPETNQLAPFARLESYADGSSVAKSLYLDADLTVTAPNPVVADNRGRFPQLFYGAGAYRTRLTREDGTLLSEAVGLNRSDPSAVTITQSLQDDIELVSSLDVELIQVAGELDTIKTVAEGLPTINEAVTAKTEAAASLAAVQSLVAALPAGTTVYATKADMDAVTPTPPAMAYVLDDNGDGSASANNGLYGYPTGASAWAKDASDLNDRLVTQESAATNLRADLGQNPQGVGGGETLFQQVSGTVKALRVKRHYGVGLAVVNGDGAVISDLTDGSEAPEDNVDTLGTTQKNGWMRPGELYINDARQLVRAEVPEETPPYVSAPRPAALNSRDQAGVQGIQTTFSQDADAYGGEAEGGRDPQRLYSQAVGFSDGTSGRASFFETTALSPVGKFLDVIVQYGQSLSVGRVALADDPPLSTVCPFPGNLLMMGSVRYPTAPDAPTVPTLTDAVEAASSTLSETGMVAMGAALLGPLGWQGKLGDGVTNDRKLLIGTFGRGGRSYTELQKGAVDGFYEEMLDFLNAAKRWADANGYTMRVIAAPFIHGNQDTEIETSALTYAGYLNDYHTDINTDWKAITGQTENIPLILHQQGRTKNDLIGGATMGTLQFVLDNPTKGFLMGPDYMNDKWADTQHKTKAGYRNQGIRIAAPIGQYWVQGKTSEPPVHFVKATEKAGDIIQLAGHPVWGAILNGGTRVTDPGSLGLTVNVDGTDQTISSVSISGRYVSIQMAGALASGTVTQVVIAGGSTDAQQGPETGSRTPLRVSGAIHSPWGDDTPRHFCHQQITVERL